MQDQFDELIKKLEEAAVILETIPRSDKFSKELIIIGINLMDYIQWSKEVTEKNNGS
jgi:hypothetical protein